MNPVWSTKLVSMVKRSFSCVTMVVARGVGVIAGLSEGCCESGLLDGEVDVGACEGIVVEGLAVVVYDPRWPTIK